jgi:hypothetical protein
LLNEDFAVGRRTFVNRLERTILKSEIGDAKPRLAVRSKTRVDAGRWWRRTRLWVCVTDHDVVVLVAARRCHIECVPIAQCQGSYYCHTTGQLVINAGEQLRFSRLAMSPVDGLRVLGALDGANHDKSNELAQ